MNYLLKEIEKKKYYIIEACNYPYEQQMIYEELCELRLKLDIVKFKCIIGIPDDCFNIVINFLIIKDQEK